MKTLHISILAVAALLTVGCKQNSTHAEPRPTPHVVSYDTPEPEADEPEEAVAASQTNRSTQSNRSNQNTQSNQNTRTKATAETLYVETDGAQGRVWGHVTMKGDHGTGTIHDWDENTLAVTVTRHGNELFAVDQNSRQYVFKLKQNKTQQ